MQFQFGYEEEYPVTLLNLRLLQALGRGHFQMPLAPVVLREFTIMHLELLRRD